MIPEEASPAQRRSLVTSSDSRPLATPGIKTLDLHEAAAFLHMHPEEVRTRAKRGLIPGAKAGPVFVFSYEGNPVFQASTAAWYKALARAGIENFRWHDLRHTWASWHVQGGTPLFALQELAG